MAATGAGREGPSAETLALYGRRRRRPRTHHGHRTGDRGAPCGGHPGRRPFGDPSQHPQDAGERAAMGHTEIVPDVSFREGERSELE